MSNTYSSMNAFVINMDNRPDRWESVLDHLHRYGFLNVTRISACRPDVSEITEERTKDFHFGPERVEDFQTYARGAIGCLQSHIKVLRTAIEMDLDSYIAFEDDVVISEGSQDYLDKAIKEVFTLDWDMFFLGGNHRSRRKTSQIGNYLKRIPCTYQAHAYAVNKKFYPTLLEHLEKCYAEVDHYYAEVIHPNYNCYGIRKDIAFQSGSPSSIPHNIKNKKTLKKRITSKIRKLLNPSS